MMTDDIRDLLGRYATGSLTDGERKRLFDAALDDQELFEELAREDEMKELFAGPGVRDRLIRALEPPKRRVSWVWALAPVAVLSAVLFVVLTRPVPKPQEVAVATVSAPPVAPVEPAVSEPQPVAAPAPVKAKAVERRDAPELKEEDSKSPPDNAVKKDAPPKAMDQVAAAPPPAPQKQADAVTVQVQAQASQVQGVPAIQQNSPAGPRQNAVQSAPAPAPVSRAAGKIAALAAPGFGFHYSVQTAGHLMVIPSADGYLAVKSGDGAALFPSQRIAAGVVIDIVLPDSVRSVSIVFSTAASPAPMTPAVRTAPEGDVQAPVGGTSAIAIELRLIP